MGGEQMNRELGDFEEWNEQMARKYNPDQYHNSSNVVIRAIEGLRSRAILKLLAVRDGDTVIELGCGAGNLLQKMPRGELWGVDLSKMLLEIASTRLAPRGATLVRANIEALPPEVGQRKFDKILCSEVIEHVQHPDRVIDQMLGIATPASRVVISVPNERIIDLIKSALIKTRLIGLFKGIARNMTDEWHLWSMDLASLRKLVAGKLDIVTIKRVPFYFLPIRYVVLLRKPR